MCFANTLNTAWFLSEFRNRRICKFLGFPDISPLLFERIRTRSFPSISKESKKNLEIFTVLRLLTYVLFLNMNLNVPKISNNKNKLLFYCISKAIEEKSQLWIQISYLGAPYGSTDPGPYQNVTDAEHCFYERCWITRGNNRFHSVSYDMQRDTL